ncbi:MAG: Asp-tRNA(Asn)/Glu-tRNA(Gln) amidotransferase subunit GatB [bacterium]|nr:Asp-tRNA(Asn)/Glu-tRNA(Gln) amidotransferase subunit GatB [bacterium]
MNYELVIGLEVHIQPNTKSKMFCSCSADIFAAKPNSHTCPTCLGLPGALPVPNKMAIEQLIKLGFAFGCNINLNSKFDRKHYYYPDLPKGYQISQYDKPFCVGGKVVLEGGKEIRITRIHMEEDTGKLSHVENKTLVDYNRSGMPLIELVTEPDFKSLQDLDIFTRELRLILRHLNISDADMEKGQLRLEANVSVRKIGEVNLPNYKVELKNINSFKFMLKAIEFEFKRQSEILESGKTPAQETRGWNENKNETFLQRTKETADDYRYFPEPDIPPILLKQSYVDSLAKCVDDLPIIKRERLKNELGLSEHEINVFINDLGLLKHFYELIKLSEIVNAKDIAKKLVNSKESQKLSAQEFFDLLKNEKSSVITNIDELKEIIKTVITENQKAYEDFKNGNENSIQFLVGQVMKKTKGKADAGVVINIIKGLNGNSLN